MKVLVIGGAGYIGSHVVKALLSAGHAVTVFDNLSSGQLGNLFPGAGFIAGDIRHPDDINGAFAKGFDACVHLAAFKAVGESMSEPEKYSVNNITGTLNILNAMSANGCKNIVFSSSAATFGQPEYVPMDEKHLRIPATTALPSWKSNVNGTTSSAASVRCPSLFQRGRLRPFRRITGLEWNPQNLLPSSWKSPPAGARTQIFGQDYDTPRRHLHPRLRSCLRSRGSPRRA